LENEFARILLEQGLPGLMIWICFIFWAFRVRIEKNDDFQLTKTLLWFRVATIWATAWIGIGMMTTIPGTAITFLAMGFIITPPLAKKEESYFNLNFWPRKNSSPSLPAYQRGLARA
jgi:O-antigen ligase